MKNIINYFGMLKYIFFLICFINAYLIYPINYNYLNISKPINPKKIVSLAPNITEILYQLNLDKNTIGITSHCPKKNNNQIIIGSYINPNFEKIVSINPNIILATAEGLNKMQAKIFERLKIPLYIIFPKNISQLIDTYNDLIILLNISDTKNIDNFINKIKYQIKLNQRFKKQDFIYIIYFNPLISVSNNTYINDLFKQSNFINKINKNIRFPRISLEELILNDPNVLLFNKSQKQLAINLLQKLYFLKAIKNKNYFFLDDDIFSRPGPKTLIALKKLEEIHTTLNKNLNE